MLLKPKKASTNIMKDDPIQSFFMYFYMLCVDIIAFIRIKFLIGNFFPKNVKQNFEKEKQQQNIDVPFVITLPSTKRKYPF